MLLWDLTGSTSTVAEASIKLYGTMTTERRDIE